MATATPLRFDASLVGAVRISTRFGGPVARTTFVWHVGIATNLARVQTRKGRRLDLTLAHAAEALRFAAGRT